MHLLILFLGNVIAHWISFMSGIVSISFGIVEYARNRKATGVTFAVIAGLFLLASCYEAWQDEHKNAELLISEKAVTLSEAAFWKEQSYAKDATIRDQNRANLDYIKAATEAQKTANGTQQSLTELTEKVFEGTKPVPPRIITYATRLHTVDNAEKPSDTTVILVGSVTRDYPAFKGTIDCATPFEIKETLLSQGTIGATSPATPGMARSIPITFFQANWRVGEPLFALIHGEGLDPTFCHINPK